MSKSTILAAAAVLMACATSFSAGAAAPAAQQTLVAFGSDQEISATLQRWMEQQRRRESRRAEANQAPLATSPAAAEASLADAESVTNVQHAGVDEGGIVKVHGDHLVVLRRGRLFTVRIGAGELRPVAAVDAFGPDIDPASSWYDELLISGNTIVVIGYSYERGGSELGLFDISANGHLTYRATYHLRSNDYYSSNNYASRLIGDRLILYAPLDLNPYAADVFEQFPALRKWHGARKQEAFRRIAPATRIYHTAAALDLAAGITLHTVTVCQLSKPELECQSTAVMAPPGEEFYVAPSSVYVWTAQWDGSTQEYSSESTLLRIPLDGAAPSALKVAGVPIDQFSFLEEAGHLNVLVNGAASNAGLWAMQTDTRDLALLRIALDAFADGRQRVAARAYRNLPAPPAGYLLHNRFVGGYLLYGVSTVWQGSRAITESKIYAVRYAQQRGAYALDLGHGVERIEALGNDAVVVGADADNLYFTSLRLGYLPSVAGKYVRAQAAQGETRSHGFFYKPDSARGGLLGLPILGGSEPAARQSRHGSAAVLYLRNDGLEFSELGALRSRAGRERDDGCRASCVDWYGNARPLFLRGRVFALLGYEIVEGVFGNERIQELRRVNFARRQVSVRN